MTKPKKLTLLDRIRRAVRAFQEKPVGFLTYGMEIKKCCECEEKQRMVLYECDYMACGDECPNPFCHLTTDVRHAVNFEIMESERGVTYYKEISRNESEEK